MTSESLKFIWQPRVSMYTLRGVIVVGLVITVEVLLMRLGYLICRT
jgi:hypothetical protein